MNRFKILNLLKPLHYTLTDWLPSKEESLLPQMIAFLSEFSPTSTEGILVYDQGEFFFACVLQTKNIPNTSFEIPADRYSFKQGASFSSLTEMKEFSENTSSDWVVFRVFLENDCWLSQIWIR